MFFTPAALELVGASKNSFAVQVGGVFDWLYNPRVSLH